MYMEEESMDKIAFKDVIAEHLNRYQLIKVVGTEDQYDLVPVYGTVSQEGTPVRALELNELQENIDASKQDYITAQGILKGDGSGGVSTAVAGTDYATPEQLNGKLDKTGGTINGALTVSGTLTVSTGTLYANSGIGLPTKSAIIKTTAGGLTTGATAGTDYEQVTIGGTTDRGYAKFASGLLVCWGNQGFGTQSITTAWGNLYEGPEYCIFSDFAYAFSAAPAVTAIQNYRSNSAFFVEGIYSTTATSPGKFIPVRPNPASVIVAASYIAIGRWK